MGLTDIVVILVVVLILGSAAGYVYKAKKKGRRCIGCPNGGNCSDNCSGHCGK